MNSYTRKKVTYELVTHDYLYEEPANLLKQELREPAIYNAIIKAIAEGASRLNDITMKVGEYNSVVSKYLKTLIDLGIAKKETPITEKPGKKTIYLLADNFFLVSLCPSQCECN